MRWPRVRFPLWWLMVLVAVVGSLLGAERSWRRSEHYRKQAALCAYFELQLQSYAASETNDPSWSEGFTIEERRENARLDLLESRRYGVLKNTYHGVARHPWQSLPPGTPDSVNGWDLGSLSASEIEEMVKDWKDD